MTLFKQIALLVTFVYLLLASILIINDFKRTGTFLQGQLQTTAQDMATTLGIAISNSSSDVDAASLEVLFNAVFDSGYYSNIQLLSVSGEVIHQKQQQVQVSGVPDWFLDMIPLKPAVGATQVMKGWTQLGRLELSLHPGFAYSGLYSALVSTLKWFSLLFISSIALLWLLLHYLLSPLRRVQEQANLIYKNQFVQQDKLPSTKELKSVVIAMNRMVSKVKTVFSDQENTLLKYQEMLYKDKLSGLGNRRYMLDQLQQAVAEESSFHGCLGVIKVLNFDELREKHGFEVSDNLIIKMAEFIQCEHAGLTAENVARLSDDEFAFLISSDSDSVKDYIQEIYDIFRKLDLVIDVDTEVSLVAGITTLVSDKKVGDLLSGIDYCLSKAINEGMYTIEQTASNHFDLPQGKIQWRAWFNEMLSAKRFFLAGQKAMDGNNIATHKELFIRAVDSQSQIIPASAFMPMASGLGMALDIDKVVFRLISEASTLDTDTPLALNLSAAFFEKAEAQEEFDTLLAHCAQKKISLCIEASHHVLQQHQTMCSQVSDKVKNSGHMFGIDNLDLGQSLNLLQSTQFDYVKINAKVLSGLGDSDMTTAFQALRTITQALDILIIAMAVDSADVYKKMQKIGINVMQGNFLDEPVKVIGNEL